MDAIADLARALIGSDLFAAEGALRRASAEGPAGVGRYWWLFLASAGLVALAALPAPARRRRGWAAARRRLSRLVPWRHWRRGGALVDVKLLLTNQLLVGSRLVSTAAIATAVAALVYGWLPGERALDAAGLSAAEAALVMLVITIAYDASEWAAHYACHKAPALWAFHRVHHSARVLTPFTASRQHPVEIVVEGVAAALIAGPVQGVLLALLGGVDIWLLFGANALVAASWLTLSHLRHSSVWLSFPKPIALVFSSPAQHQIHHSRDPRHWDRNFGELFSLWDWAAGTLYQPERRETLSFGLAPEAGEARPRPHETLVAALAEPFAHLRRRRG